MPESPALAASRANLPEGNHPPREAQEPLPDQPGLSLASAPANRVDALKAVDLFIRLHFIGFSTLPLLLGLASVPTRPSLLQLVGALGVAFCFHNFAFVFNDVVDLPVDRTHPGRQQDPLVRGVIRPWQALVFSLVQIPLAVTIHFSIGGSTVAFWALIAGFALMAIYDLWGKLGPVPPLTDLSQGLGWASLALYGATVGGAAPTTLTWTAVVLGAGFVLLINGVHGGLRDLENDLERGRRTTAIFFGSRPQGETRTPSMTKGLVLFSMTVQIVLVISHWVPLLRNDFGYSPANLWIFGALVFALDAACLIFMLRVFQTGSPTWQRDFRVHLFLLTFVGLVLFTPLLDPLLLALAMVLFLAPLALHRTAWEVLFRGRPRIFGSAPDLGQPSAVISERPEEAVSLINRRSAPPC